MSGLLHALVAMSPPEVETTQEGCEDLPVTSFSCKWNVPRKRKESSAKLSEMSFQKHVYGRERKNTLKTVHDFDPRPDEYHGTAPTRIENFLQSMKGKNLGVSVLLDTSTRVWDTEAVSSSHCIPSRDELMYRVSEFKSSLQLSPDSIREIEKATVGQHMSSAWYSARRYRITASMFGKVVHRLPSTPPDNLVANLLNPQRFKTPATEWGKQQESAALKMYVESQLEMGHTGLLVEEAGFVVCEQHPFLGASPDAYVNDPTAADQFGLIEIKCPYKYRDCLPEEAARNSDFCCTLASDRRSLQLKSSHEYFCQVQGQMAITNRQWCDFTVYTKRGISIERIRFDSEFWINNVLPKLIEFYDMCFCPAIISPVHLVGMRMHDLRLS